MPNVDDVDFDDVYRGRELVDGLSLVPWDIGGPQPLVVEIETAGEVHGAVLDAGCGLAENALFLASKGHDVTGIDGAPTAIERARAKAAERGLRAEFAVAEATRLDGFDDRFDTVLDSALYHCLNEEQRHEYAAALHRATKPGATLHLFCLAERMGPIPGPWAISADNLHETFGKGWRITRLERRHYTTAMTPELLTRLRESLPEAPAGEAAAGGPPTVDEQGRFLMPVWQLKATRIRP
ncbi:class I SAM-dependent methyltransferase [Amycolatopsis alkalitolerans]|uniref:Class I SAM-dependent methyltransferase n=2 Tax=Amycolatopsis alkalitolerans TaxID=2547244 RepID=A0A5C4M7A9_9PSEU|nr:class I SAM-dependent methyltransferase [Amycolatopsis alkalitolerans]